MADDLMEFDKSLIKKLQVGIAGSGLNNFALIQSQSLFPSKPLGQLYLVRKPKAVKDFMRDHSIAKKDVLRGTIYLDDQQGGSKGALVFTPERPFKGLEKALTKAMKEAKAGVMVIIDDGSAAMSQALRSGDAVDADQDQDDQNDQSASAAASAPAQEKTGQDSKADKRREERQAKAEALIQDIKSLRDQIKSSPTAISQDTKKGFAVMLALLKKGQVDRATRKYTEVAKDVKAQLAEGEDQDDQETATQTSNGADPFDGFKADLQDAARKIKVNKKTVPKETLVLYKQAVMAVGSGNAAKAGDAVDALKNATADL